MAKDQSPYQMDSWTRYSEDLVKCHICKDHLSDCRSLPCADTFCLRCLQGYAKDKSQDKPIGCPVCTKEFTIPEGGLHRLEKSLFLQKLSDTKASRKGEIVPKVCKICDNRNYAEATRYCCDCRQELCKECEKQHRKIKGTATHDIIHIGNVMHLLQKTGREQFCEMHPGKILQLYCTTCDTVLCWHCLSQQHTGHSCCGTKEASEQFVAQFQKQMEHLSELTATKEQNLMRCQRDIRIYKQMVNFELENINRISNDLIRTIIYNTEDLQRQLSAEASAHEEVLLAQISRKGTELEQVKRQQFHIEHLKTLGNFNEICADALKLITKTESLRKNETSVVFPRRSNLRSEIELQTLLTSRPGFLGSDSDESQRPHISEEKKEEKASIGGFSRITGGSSLGFIRVARDGIKKTNSNPEVSHTRQIRENLRSERKTVSNFGSTNSTIFVRCQENQPKELQIDRKATVNELITKVKTSFQGVSNHENTYVVYEGKTLYPGAQTLEEVGLRNNSTVELCLHKSITKDTETRQTNF